MTRHVLTLSCPNKPGVVAKIATALFDGGFNVLDAQQFDDTETNVFFMRVEFDVAEPRANIEVLREKLYAIAASFTMTWSMRPTDQHKRVVIMVSRFDHCLVDLLYRWRNGELAMEPVGDHRQLSACDLCPHRIWRHSLPLPADHQANQDGAGGQAWEVIKSAKTDFIILARYMQVLSDGFVAKLQGHCVNIHHSFLPGFKGAKPYHQAHQRGVKLIGATAHYVTSELDEGPIIEQDVERISHRDSPEGSRSQGARHRAPCARPRRRQCPRGPGAVERPKNGGVRGIGARLPQALGAPTASTAARPHRCEFRSSRPLSHGGVFYRLSPRRFARRAAANRTHPGRRVA